MFASGLLDKIITYACIILCIITGPISVFFCLKIAQEYERAVIFRLGRVVKGPLKGPGMFFVIPCIDIFYKIDIRTIAYDIPSQEVLSKDSVTVSVDAVVYYKIKDALKATVHLLDYSMSTRLLAAATLRRVMGTHDLAELLAKRDAISTDVYAILFEATENWGIEVERVEIKDVRLPPQLQKAMAAEAEAIREAKATVIAAQAEIKTSKSLKDASHVMKQNPMALQLRYLQTLNIIASAKSHTIVFPLPMEFLARLAAGGGGGPGGLRSVSSAYSAML